MKSILHLPRCLSLLTFAFVVSLARPALSLAAPLTADQARQALLSYVQAPDTTLNTAPVVTTDGITGHTTFGFLGDSHGGYGGSYQIDATSGTKTIEYQGLSTWDRKAGDAPAFLSSSQLIQVATNFAAAHFPPFASSTLLYSNDGSAPAVTDLDSFEVSFGCTLPSGAEQPIACSMEVEEDTGCVRYYVETNIPITISTNPAVTQAQAVQFGQNWISQNLTTDPAAGQLEADLGGDTAVELLVDVDPSMNETLIYKIRYVATVLSIDAQTGAVLSEDDWMGGANLSRKPSLSPQKREQLVDVRTDRSITVSSNGRQAIRTKGQTYLWVGYLPYVGVGHQQLGRKIDLSRGKTRLRLPVKLAPSGDTAAWSRRDRVYVPISALRSLDCTIDDRDPVVLHATPAATAVSAVPARGRGATATLSTMPPRVSAGRSPRRSPAFSSSPRARR